MVNIFYLRGFELTEGVSSITWVDLFILFSAATTVLFVISPQRLTVLSINLKINFTRFGSFWFLLLLKWTVRYLLGICSWLFNSNSFRVSCRIIWCLRFITLSHDTINSSFEIWIWILIWFERICINIRRLSIIFSIHPKFILSCLLDIWSTWALVYRFFICVCFWFSYLRASNLVNFHNFIFLWWFIWLFIGLSNGSLRHWFGVTVIQSIQLKCVSKSAIR